jgi:hypothetical protein
VYIAVTPLATTTGELDCFCFDGSVLMAPV